jgi:hypothetical protein
MVVAGTVLWTQNFQENHPAAGKNDMAAAGCDTFETHLAKLKDLKMKRGDLNPDELSSEHSSDLGDDDSDPDFPDVQLQFLGERDFPDVQLGFTSKVTMDLAESAQAMVAFEQAFAYIMATERKDPAAANKLPVMGTELAV